MAVIDVRVLDRLVDDLGRTSVHGLVTTFLDALAERSERLGAAVRGGDLVAAGKVAHQLRSTSLLVGAMSLGEACRSLESVAEAGDSAAVAHVADEIATLAPAVAGELRTWLTA